MELIADRIATVKNEISEIEKGMDKLKHDEAIEELSAS